MDIELQTRAKNQLKKVDEALRKYTSHPDTVSPQIKEGLADVRYQVGSLSKYPRLLRATAHGDIDRIKEESKVWYFNNRTGKMIYDENRHQ